MTAAERERRVMRADRLAALLAEREELQQALRTGRYGRIVAVELREPEPVVERTLRVVRGAA